LDDIHVANIGQVLVIERTETLFCIDALIPTIVCFFGRVECVEIDIFYRV
jgi:hypothetical protein